MSDADQFDVIIAGGGLVGASLAVALAPTGLRIGVVEAFAPSPAQPSFDDRATALAASSKNILHTLGLWDALDSASPIRTIHVSDRGRFGGTRLGGEADDSPAFGYVIENRVLGDVLWGALRASDAHIWCPARISTARAGDAGMRLDIETDEGRRCVSAALVVVAEGALSSTRDLLGVSVDKDHYGRSAVVANVTTEKHHGQRAFERFTDDGPLAFLPLSGGRCNVVWSLPTETAETLVQDDAEFIALLQDAFGFRLGKIRRAGVRHTYPLSRIVARPLYGDRWVLIGNAANSVHPVAGQGFNLGLRDMATLAELIVDNRDELDGDLLTQYTQWRAPDHRHVLTMTDSLVRAFTSPVAPVGVLRDAALVAMQLLPPARRWFARRGMGYVGTMPRLARGISLT